MDNNDACCDDDDWNINAIMRKKKTTTKNDCNYNTNINGEDNDKCDTSSICEINKQKLTLCLNYVIFTWNVIQSQVNNKTITATTTPITIMITIMQTKHKNWQLFNQNDANSKSAKQRPKTGWTRHWGWSVRKRTKCPRKCTSWSPGGSWWTKFHCVVYP